MSTRDSKANGKAAPKVKKTGFFSKIKTTYLFSYNFASKLGWAYVLYITVLHLLAIPPPPLLKALSSKLATSALDLLLSQVPLNLRTYLTESTTGSPAYTQLWELLPPAAAPYVARAKTLYYVVGPEVAFVQTCAVFEILHVILRLVPSSVVTTTAQVFSRLWAVWGIVARFPETRSNPLYATMIIAWSVAEIIRYTSYATTVIGYPIYLVQWLRYTAFYILYPIGASSEAFLMFSTLPSFSSLLSGAWEMDDYIRLALFVIWWPSLFTLMGYMSSQRRKALGKGKKTKTA